MVEIPCFWVWKCGDTSFDFSRKFLIVGGLVYLIYHIVASEKDYKMSETMSNDKNLLNPHLFEPLFYSRA